MAKTTCRVPDLPTRVAMGEVHSALQEVELAARGDGPVSLEAFKRLRTWQKLYNPHVTDPVFLGEPEAVYETAVIVIKTLATELNIVEARQEASRQIARLDSLRVQCME